MEVQFARSSYHANILFVIVVIRVYNLCTMIIPSNVEWYILQVTTILRELIKYYSLYTGCSPEVEKNSIY